MKIRNMFSALFLVGLMTTMSIAIGETVELGPANVSLELSGAGSYRVEAEESSELEHKHGKNVPEFKYFIYPSTVSFDGTSNRVIIEIHKMSGPSKALNEQIQGRRAISALEHCIEQANIIPRRSEYEAKSYTIDGHEGILATVDAGEKNPLYIAAYSPDEINGSGSIICIIGSEFPWNTTKSIFDSVKTQFDNEANENGASKSSGSDDGGKDRAVPGFETTIAAASILGISLLLRARKS